LEDTRKNDYGTAMPIVKKRLPFWPPPCPTAREREYGVLGCLENTNEKNCTKKSRPKNLERDKYYAYKS
jgi:hypothetical protein